MPDFAITGRKIRLSKKEGNEEDTFHLNVDGDDGMDLDLSIEEMIRAEESSFDSLFYPTAGDETGMSGGGDLSHDFDNDYFNLS